jgi:hypothetical protein
LLRCYRKKWYFQILALIKSLSIVLLHFKSWSHSSKFWSILLRPINCN